MLCGGTRGIEIDDKVRSVAEKMKSEVEKQANESFSIFEPVEAMSQVVAGINYFIKVKVGDDKAIFMRVWDHFGDLSLSAIQTGKTMSDPIAYF